MKKVALTVLSLGLAFANVGRAAIITIGILPAISDDFRQSMNYDCNRADSIFGGAGDAFACFGKWVLDEDIKVVLQSLEASGVLQIIDAKVQKGEAGNIDLNIPDSLMARFGKDKVKEVLELYIETAVQTRAETAR